MASASLPISRETLTQQTDLKGAVLKHRTRQSATGGGPPDVKPPFYEWVLDILGERSAVVNGIAVPKTDTWESTDDSMLICLGRQPISTSTPQHESEIHQEEAAFWLEIDGNPTFVSAVVPDTQTVTAPSSCNITNTTVLHTHADTPTPISAPITNTAFTNQQSQIPNTSAHIPNETPGTTAQTLRPVATRPPIRREAVRRSRQTQGACTCGGTELWNRWLVADMEYKKAKTELVRLQSELLRKQLGQ